MKNNKLIKLIDKLIKIRLEKLFSSKIFISLIELAVKKYLDTNLNNIKKSTNIINNNILKSAQQIPFTEKLDVKDNIAKSIINEPIKPKKDNLIIKKILENTNPYDVSDVSAETEALIQSEISKMGIDANKIEFNPNPKPFIDKYESEYIKDE